MTSLRGLLALLRRGLVSEGDAEELFLGLRELFGSNGLVIGQDIDFSAWSRTEGLSEDWMAAHTRLRDQDPAIRLLMRSPAGAQFFAMRDASPEERRAEIFDRFHAAGYTDVAICKIYSPFRDDLFMGVYLPNRSFDEHDAELLDLLYPHLAAGLATRRALRVLETKAIGATSGRPFTAPSITVSFPEGTVRADGPARAAIERRIGKVGTMGWARVEAAIANAARRFLVPQAGGRSLVLWPGLRVDFAVMPPERGETMRLVGFLVEEGADLDEEPVPALVDAVLSRRQLAVARAFVAGSSVTTISEALRLSSETVRWHLRVVYDKLGVRTRAGLRRALAS